MAEFVFRGPTYETSRTTVMIDERQDPKANDTSPYLAGRVDLIVNELRQLGGILTVTEPATPRTIAGHEGRMFVAVDTYHGIAYRVAVVVSATHERWWVILLTVDSDYLSVYESMFGAMLDGFEITVAQPAAPAGPLLLIAVAVGGIGAAGLSAIGVWRVLRRHGVNTRAKRLGSIAGYSAPYQPPRDIPKPAHRRSDRPRVTSANLMSAFVVDSTASVPQELEPTSLPLQV